MSLVSSVPKGKKSGSGSLKKKKATKKQNKKDSSSKPADEKPRIVKVCDRPSEKEKKPAKKVQKTKPGQDEGKVKQVKPKEKKAMNKRERRLLRLKSKKHSEIVMKLLPLWEVLRRIDTPKEKRFTLIDDILSKAKGKVADLCLPHDSARIIECAIQYATEAQRWKIFSEMKSQLRLLSKSKYSKHIVLKLLKYGAKEHQLDILKVFRGHMVKLIKNRISAEVIDSLFNDYANASQRGTIMQELYGNVHALKLSENQVYTLAGAIALNPDKRHVILKHVNELLVSMVTKGLTKYTVVQHLLLEYFQAVTDTKATTEAKTENPSEQMVSLLEVLVEGQVVPMLHTREGVRAALYTLWNSPPRLRRPLVRGMKTCVSSVARNEHGHLFLIGLLDMVDDTVMLRKLIIKEIVEDLSVFCTHPEARKVLLYILSPRHPHHFSPQFQQSIFLAGDSNPHTKKPLGVRALELRHPDMKLLPRLLELISNDLKETFIGSSSPRGRLAYEDRGRIVLLAEALIRSAPHHLSFDNVVSSYKRTASSSHQPAGETTDTSTAVTFSEEDVAKLTHLRKKAMLQIVQELLVPTFAPVGFHSSDGKGTAVDRDEERMKRHKRAVRLVEIQLGQVTKPDFASFEDGERMDVSEEEEEFVEPSTLAIMPFLERPEGQFLMRRLLKDGAANKDFTFGRMIMKHVPPSNLCSWTKCNRSCFVLVQLYEMKDSKICSLLKSALDPCTSELSISPLPGAKVLHKLLTAIV